MKFFKTKIKRCKNCKYYKTLGNLHFCINTEFYQEGDELKQGGIFRGIPLICFKKERRK